MSESYTHSQNSSRICYTYVGILHTTFLKYFIRMSESYTLPHTFLKYVIRMSESYTHLPNISKILYTNVKIVHTFTKYFLQNFFFCRMCFIFLISLNAFCTKMSSILSYNNFSLSLESYLGRKWNGLSSHSHTIDIFLCLCVL
jgi:hypothetical protein